MGNPRDQMTQSLLLCLTPLQVGFFRISLFILNGIYSNKAHTWKMKLFMMV